MRRIYEFGPFLLDPAERRLTRDSAPVAITPKVFDLLVALVERRGRLVEKDALLKLVWPDSFVEEANLTVHMSSLRRLLGEAADGGEYVETVPRRGYRFVAPAAERELEDDLPTVLAGGPEPAPHSQPFAPSTAATEPSRQPMAEPPAAATPPGPAEPSRRRWWPGSVAAAALIGAVAWWAWSGREAPATETRRVGVAGTIETLAILPFLPLGDDADATALGLGMADALITRLSNLRQISVRPTSSVLRYGRAGRDALAAGRELAVDGLLEGHVQRAGSAIRVTVQLLSVRDGTPLWAERFDEDQASLFALEDSISERIAAALSLTLSGSERQALSKHATGNPAAYEDYQMGRYLVLRGTIDAANKAVDYFQAAIAKDPGFGAAHAGLATARITTAGNGGPQDYAEAASHAEKALALDPGLSDAHLAVGWVAMYSKWDWDGAERAFRAGLERSPSSSIAHLALSTVLTARRRHGEAIDHMLEANALEPTSVLIVRNLAWTHFQARRFEVAERWARRAIEMDRNDGASHRELARSLLQQGRRDDATRSLLEAQRLGANVAVELTIAAAPKADRAPELTTAFERARVLAARGEIGPAIDQVDRAIVERSDRVLWLATEPDLDPIRSDPRFPALLQRVNLGQ